MDTTTFREEMQKFTDKIVYSNENLSDGQWIDFVRIQNDFTKLVKDYLGITW